MVLDIITAALIIIPMVIGMAKGFLYIMVRMLGWIGAVVAAIFAAPIVKEFLTGTFVGEIVYDTLQEKLGAQGDAATETVSTLPSIISDSVDAAAQTAVDALVQTIGGLIMSVIAFLVVVIAIRLLLILAILPISRAIKDSKVVFLNKFAGLLVGGAEGLLLAFLFLAALIPVMNIASPETQLAITEGLKFSYLAGSLYDGNLLLAIFGSFGS